MPDLVALNQRFNQMLSHHHKFRDYEAMINSLMVVPPRKDSSAKNEGSTTSSLNLVQLDFDKYMGNETLSPIDEV